MNDYNDLMNEYEDVKNQISEEFNHISNSIILIQTFREGLESFSNQILNFHKQKDNLLTGIEKNTVDFSKLLIKEKNLIENEVNFPLNNILASTKEVTMKNLDIFNNIKVSLIQERQKLNKTKEDYFNFISSKATQSSNNEDENLLFNAKKENFFQLYKYEVNQMNVIIDENNTLYKNMYNELNNWKKIRENKIKFYFQKFANYIANIGNLFIDFSKNLLKTLNEDGNNINQIKLNDEKDENNLNKKPRFEKVIVEEYENKENEIEEDKKEEDKEAGQKSKSNDINNNELLDFDVLDDEEMNSYLKESEQKKSTTIKEKLTSGFGLFNKIKALKKNKSEAPKEKDKELSIKKPSKSSGLDEFELVSDNLINIGKNSLEKNEKILDDIIKKMISKDELISQDINMLMNLLKEENPSTKKLYSYTFLTKLSKMNKKYIINLNNRKNFMHLSNIINDIVINDSSIDILKLIIEISQIIIYKDLYLFNILRKKNQYLSTKSFWSNLVMEFFINELNNKTKLILAKQVNTKDNSHNKDKESNIYLLEYIKFSNKIPKYNKLNAEQKMELDKYARNNIINVLAKIIEGMCSFYVKKSIILDVIIDFGKNFGFSQEDNTYYKLLAEAYLNRNYIYNLKKLSLKEKEEEKISKICIISNSAKFLQKSDLMNLLFLEKCMTEPIKKNIFKNILRQNIPIDERTRVWGLMFGIYKLKKEYNYSQILTDLLKKIETNEIKNDSEFEKNMEVIKLDVVRTNIKDKINKAKHQKSLNNILMCLIYLSKGMGYYQGMNYIAGFLYQVFDYDEEKTFYYMLAIHKNTKYSEIFKNELYLMRRFFEVFIKIMKIYIPEIYQHQKNNDLNVNYYMPPWFTTLFMFCASIFDKNDAPKLNLMIFEDFILNGWSAIFNIGYTIIKFHKNEIIGLKDEKLLDFMINNFGKVDAKNENFENIQKEYIKYSYQINEELIDKLLKIQKYEENKDKNKQS